MNRFKNLLLVTVAFSAVVLAVSLNSVGHVIAQAVQEVRVVNRINQAVPVSNPPGFPIQTKVISSATDPIFARTAGNVINDAAHSIPVVLNGQVSGSTSINVKTAGNDWVYMQETTQKDGLEELARALNERGIQGWELVVVMPSNTGSRWSYVLKKPR
jgi:archaellum component FlaG (FlaF/FlaG flagellin family)